MKGQPFIFIFLSVATFVIVNGCRKSQPCEFIRCEYGLCTDGRCKCPTGYEGDKCLTKVRNKYLGTFTGSEQCSVSYDGAYSITISANTSDVTKVNFYNMWGADTNTTGEIKDDGNVYFLSQPFRDGSMIIGKAMLINGKLKVSYTITGESQLNGQTDNCVWIEQ